MAKPQLIFSTPSAISINTTKYFNFVNLINIYLVSKEKKNFQIYYIFEVTEELYEVIII